MMRIYRCNVYDAVGETSARGVLPTTSPPRCRIPQRN
jgi:hypothetical protein